MVTSWVFSLIIILIFRHYASRPKLVPPLGQAVIENMVTGIKDIVEPIIGPHMVKPAFPLLMGLFTFILIQNWTGLLPGVGTFGFYDEHGHLDYWFRPGNADLNMTIALALVAFFSWIYLILKSEVPTLIYYALFIIFFGVGLIEIISILFRPVSLSFRLFGNMFGGENLLTSMTGMVGYIVPVPFYFLELLIGLVQALVFTLLVAVYIGLICNHEGEEHAH
jgi:F-type H+-transporting ATPase subunit a